MWCYAHDQFLGYAWDGEERETRRARVTDPNHAIYVDTFAEVMVATDKVFSPYRLLHANEPGHQPYLIR